MNIPLGGSRGGARGGIRLLACGLVEVDGGVVEVICIVPRGCYEVKMQTIENKVVVAILAVIQTARNTLNRNGLRELHNRL